VATIPSTGVRTVRAKRATAGQPVCLRSAGGLVTANSAPAAAAGARTLAAGGNAMDAAAATAFASGVVEPAMSGIGGRGYLVVLEPGSTEPAIVDGHERAPASARPDMFELAATGSRLVSGWGVGTDVVGAANRDGHRAVAVPAVVPALAEAHRRFGALPWRALLEPAIQLAREGVVVDETLAAAIAGNHARLARFPASAAIFLPAGRLLRAGDRLVQRDLARSLQALADLGPEELADGGLARALAAEVARGGGTLALDDLRRIEPRVWAAPATATFHGHRILGVPGATGAVTLSEILNMIEALGVEAEARVAADSHCLAEIFRAAFEDRWRHVDDEEAVAVPFAGLANERFARMRAAAIDRERRGDVLAPVDPWPFEGADRPDAAAAPAAGGAPGDRHTTHFCAVDESRMVVSMTQSLVDEFGSAVVVPGTGVLLNSAMHNFNPAPGRIGSIGPGRRAPHFGTPLVVLTPDGRPRLAIGGGGGTRIVTGIAQVLTRVLGRGEPLASAIAAPRIHCEGGPIEVDHRAVAVVRAGLQLRGHRVQRAVQRFGRPAFARLNGIEIAADGGLTGGVDPYTNAGASTAQRL
jgi:gamma-glutamyltranspeptidase/glutathione hydrolase